MADAKAKNGLPRKFLFFLAIAVMLLAYPALKELLPSKPEGHGSGPPTYTIGCAKYADDAVDLPNVQEAFVVVPPADAASGEPEDGCTTQWVARPRLSPVEEEWRRFLVYPERTIWIQRRYADGSFGYWQEFNPRFERSYDKKLIVAMRFKKSKVAIRMKFDLGNPLR